MYDEYVPPGGKGKYGHVFNWQNLRKMVEKHCIICTAAYLLTMNYGNFHQRTPKTAPWKRMNVEVSMTYFVIHGEIFELGIDESSTLLSVL